MGSSGRESVVLMSRSRRQNSRCLTPRALDPRQRIDERSVRMLPGVTARGLSDTMTSVERTDPTSTGKRSVARVLALARWTLAARLRDRDGTAPATHDTQVIGQLNANGAHRRAPWARIDS